MQAGSHGNAGMWGVRGDKSREPSQREGRDGATEGGMRKSEGEIETGRAASLRMGDRNTTPKQPESESEREREREGRGTEGGTHTHTHTGDGKPALFLFAFHLHPWPYRPIGLGAKPRA